MASPSVSLGRRSLPTRVTRLAAQPTFMSSASYPSLRATAIATGAARLVTSRVTTSGSTSVSPFSRRKSSSISALAAAQLTMLSVRS